MTRISNSRLNCSILITKVTGATINMSEYLDFKFYDKAWYRDNTGFSPIKPGQWLVVAEK